MPRTDGSSFFFPQTVLVFQWFTMGSATPPYLSQLLCIRKVVDGDSQEDIQEGVLIDLRSRKNIDTWYLHLF